MANENNTGAEFSGERAARSTRKAAVDIFLISVVILFLELACIRWFPAHVLYLTFFTNMILLACFLGMSLGCLAARHRWNYIKTTPVLLVLTLLAGNAVELLRDQVERVLDVGGQASPQLVYFGTEYYSRQSVDRFIIPVEVLGGLFFVLIALALVGPGQELGRALTRLPNRVQAYTVNIVGSIVGIALFSLMSWFRLSPAWWFFLVALGLGYFLFGYPYRVLDLVVRAGLLGMIVVMAAATGLMTNSEIKQEIWSPYYRVDFYPPTQLIRVNLISHQQMNSRMSGFPAYTLPHLLNRDSGGRPFENVLIIGAGSGNDVSRALQWGAQHVDAVEIDPVIPILGRLHHPDAPYSEVDRVTVHQADGRNFLRTTDKKYDLIVFALVDSLVLHSSYSNIRLESYLFTKQAFEDVKRCLKPDGVFVMYNFFRQGWIVARLQKTLTEVFDIQPIVFTLPYLSTVEPDKYWDGFTFFISGRASALERLRTAFHLTDPKSTERVFYWLEEVRYPGLSSPNGFEQRPSAVQQKYWKRFGVADVKEPEDLAVATDDWPFLYLRRPMIPNLSLRGAAIMGGLALMLLLWFAPRRKTNGETKSGGETHETLPSGNKERVSDSRSPFFDGRMFFLGAGFMLIETKAVVHMALLFGSTWMVNSVVFLAVLVMILLANLFVTIFRPRLLWPYYLGLSVALILNAVIPLDSFLGWRPELRMIGSCLLVFAPVLFAAVIFAVSFSRTREADRAFGFNIAGAMAGGLAEYSSMLLGFRYLLLLALAFYALSALWRTTVNGLSSALPATEPNV